MKKQASGTIQTNAKLESREDKLKRLASMKVGKALHHINLCANLAYYKPTPTQVSVIIEALTSAVSEVKSRLTSNAPAASIKFSL